LASNEPPKWSPLDEEIWPEARPKKNLIGSADGDYAQTEGDRAWEIRKWLRRLRKEISIDEMIDRVKARLQNADAEDQFDLEFELRSLLTEAFRRDEVLQLIDQKIEREPDSARALISKASFYHYTIEDPKEALKWIDIALERAYRTKFFARSTIRRLSFIDG
jgi:tetratricopeptide (TPR) repeat protein